MDCSPTSPGSPTRPPDRWPRTDRAFGLACLLAAVASGPAAALDPAEPLAAERAFALSVQAVDPRTLVVRYDIAAGHYLYRDKLRFAVEPGGLAAPPPLPAGEVKDDPYFGRTDVLRGSIAVRIPLDRERPGEKLTLIAESQGCAERGICYPLQRQTVAVALPLPGAAAGPVVEAAPRRKGWFN